MEIGKTPIVISDHLEFVSKAKWEADHSVATGLVNAWRQDAESLDPARLIANYSERFKSDQGENLNAWFAKQRLLMAGVRNISIALREVSLFLYPGQDDLMVSTFTQDATIGKNKHTIRKRQYWAKEGAQWKIVSETSW